MAINPYHKIEDINGVRCSVVERNVSAERAAFLRNVLATNKFEVVEAETDGKITIGVTDVMFNPIHALYGRFLHTADKKVVTPAQWFQKEQLGEFYWQYSKP